MSNEKDISVGFMGCGMMASALMGGLVSEKLVKDPSSITCSDVYKPSVENAATKGYSATESNEEVCNNAKDAVVIAVKPNVVEDVCSDIRKVDSDALIISIAAGITLETLEKFLPGRRVVRVMPNTPCLVGEAASGYAMGQLCIDQDR